MNHIRKKLLFLFLLALTCSNGFAKKEKEQYVKLTTSYGDICLKLYNKTPKHRDNFLKLIKTKQLNGTLFHRVINDFMIQGGDPDSKNAKPAELLGRGDLGYTIDAEIFPDLIHKRGALAAARNNNPQRASSASQFYIVHGKVFNDMQIAYLEQDRGIKLSEEHKKIYKTLGGSPFLDSEYTVFGEVVKGMDVVDKIASVKTDRNNRPLEDIKMTAERMKKREVKKLLKQAKG